MKKKIAIIVLGASISFTSCEENSNSITLPDDDIKFEEGENHQISKEQALKSLCEFMEAFDGNLKSLKLDLDTAEMWGISYSKVKEGNKALSSTIDNNMVYVANFANEQGYAILAADNRIQDEVLMIADNGSLSKVMVNSTIEMMNDNRPIFDNYPLTGSGYFTVPEYPDEVFMNPNTVSLYDEQENDTYVGTYFLDNLSINDENEESIGHTNKASYINGDEQSYGLELTLKYAARQLDGPDRFKEDDEIESGGPSLRTETYKSNWTNEENVNPILSLYKRWDNWSPFNDLYPRRREYLIIGHRKKAPAGCFPLAIAKIMTHFEIPTHYIYNGYQVDWNSIKSEWGFKSELGAKSAAVLIKGISESCHSKYFYNGTFTFPFRAISFMKRIGYENVDKYNYSFMRVKNMLDDGKPIIIFGMPKFHIKESHAWNIDGYKIQSRTIIVKSYVNNTLNKTTTRTETKEMVHCDFGWKIHCNGYYISGIFDLDSKENELDPGAGTGKNVTYNNYIKIILYNL